MKSGRSIALCVGLALVAVRGAAQTFWTWDGAGANGGATNWATAANWNPDGTPADGDGLVFGTTYDVANLNDFGNRTFHSITFNANAAWKLFGNPITLMDGITNLVGTTTKEFLFGVTTTVAQTWHNAVNNSWVVFQTNSHLQVGADLEFTGAGSFAFNGVVNGGGRLISRLRGGANVASLQLTNANNFFTGGILVDDSNRVWITQSGKAGSGSIVATNGGQLWLQGASLTNEVRLGGKGFQETTGILGALRMEANAVQRGPVFLEGDTRIHVHSGDSTINGPIIGSYTIEKTGTGSLQLGNTTNIGFTGKWVVMSNGQIRVMADEALGAAPAAPVADYITLTNRARLMNWNNELILHPHRGIYIPGGGNSGGGLQAGWWAGLEVRGDISGAGALYIPSDPNPGWVVLSGANNTFQGGLTNDARLRLGANEVIPDGASAGNVVLLPQVVYPVQSVNAMRALDVAGYTETINGLFGGGVITNSVGSGVLILGNNNANGSYTGRVAAGAGSSLRVVKIGNGYQSMMGGFSGDVRLHASGGGILVATGTVAGASADWAALSAGDVAAVGVLSTPGVMAFTNGAVVFNPGIAGVGVDSDLFSANDLVIDTALTVFITPLRDLGATSVPLFSYTNSLTGSATLLTLVPTNTRYTSFTADDTTPGVITISAAGGAPNELSWVGTNALWDIGGAASFYNETVAATDVFWQADTVRFGNMVAGNDRTKTSAVTIAGQVAPARIIVEGSNNFVFTVSGSGRITGYAELFKGGTNLMVINGAHDFSGPVTVTGGTLRVGHASALGSIAGATWVTNGGTIDVNGQNLGAELFYLAGAGVANTGVVVNSAGADANNAMQRVYLAGDAVFGGNRRWDIRAVGIWPTNDAFIAPLNGPVTLAFTGTAEKAWQNVTVGSGIDVVVGQGLFRTEYNTIWQGPATNYIRVMAGASLDIYSQTNAVNRILRLDGGAELRAQMGGFTNLNVWAGPIELNGWATNRTYNNQFLTLAGDISGNGNLTILSNGTTFFTGNNSAWAGNMFIATGTVDVGKGGLSGDLGVGDVTNVGGRIVFSRTDDYTIGNRFFSVNNLTNPSIVKAGAGVVTFTNSGSTFQGNIILQNGGIALGSDTALGVTNLLYVASPTTTIRSADGSTRVLGHYLWWHTDSGPNIVGTGEMIFTNAVFNGNLEKFINVSNPVTVFTNTAPWTGTGPVVKRGPGELRLYGTVASSAFTNETGRLVLGGGGGFTHANAVLVFGQGSSFDVSGVTGGWTLGPGQTLAGVVDIAGNATLQGRVVPGLSAGTITWSNDATFLNATLVLELAKEGTVGGGVNDLIQVLGNVTLSGNNAVQVSALNNEFSAPRYALVTNVGARIGGAANLSLAMGIMANSRYAFALNDSDPNAIWLDVSGANKTLDWRGSAASGFWNVKGGTNNFLDGATPETFWQADHVRFGAATYINMSTNRYAVTISEPSAPATVTVDGPRAFSFTNVLAGARITGGATLIKLGSAPFFMGAANDYSGPTLISNGMFVLTSSSGVGVSNGATYIASGATLDVYGNMVGHEAYEEVFVSGDGVDGVGAIVNRGAAQIWALRRVTLVGDTTFGGMQRWDIRNTNHFDGWLSTGGNAYNLIKTGTNQVTLANTRVDSALGHIEIRNGVFGLETGTSGLGDPTKTVTVFTNAWLWMHNVTTPLAKDIVLRGGGGVWVNSGTIGAQQNYVEQPITLSNGIGYISGAGNALFAQFRGAGGLRKEGGGEIWLTGTNTFAGPLQMNGGTLRLMSNGTALSISGLRIEGGTLVVDNSRGVNLSDRLPDAVPVTGWGGVLRFDVATNAFSYERIGEVTIERGTLEIQQQIPTAWGTTSVVAIAGLKHVQGLINFTHSNVGGAPTYYVLGQTATNDTGPHVVIDGLADGATIPFALVNGAGFARYSTTRGVYAPEYLAEFDGFSDQTGLDTRFTVQRSIATNWLSANRSINTIVVSNQLDTAIDLRGYKLTLAGGGYRQLGTNNFEISDSIGGGTLEAGDAIFFVNTATTRVHVAMNLASLGKEGGGTLILLSSASYTGKTSIGGVLQVGDGTAATIPTDRPVWNNGTLRLNTTVDLNFTTNIYGVGGLQKYGANTLTLSGPNNLFGSSFNIYSGQVVFATGSTTVITNGQFTAGGTNVTGVGAAIVRIEPGAKVELGPVASAFYGSDFAPDRPSTFDQNGGAFLIGITNLNTVRFAHWNGTNLYNMTDGLLVISNRATMAWDGKSIFNQTGGTVRAGQIALGRIDAATVWRTSHWNLVGGTLEIGKGGMLANTTRTDAAGAQLGFNVYGGALKAWDRDKETKIWNAVPVRLYGTLTVTGGVDETVEVLGLVSGNGSLNKVGAGTLIVARTNTFTGGTVLSNGTLTVKMRNALGTGPLRVTGGTLNFSLAGLYEEHLAGNFNQHTNPRAAVAAGVYAADFAQNVSGRFMSEQATYGYQGFIVNPGPTNVVYTFAENFDDNVRLRIIIDGVTNTVLQNTQYNIPTLGTIELPPGIHRFDLRLGNGGAGSGGVGSQWWTRWDLGFGWDPEGRNAPLMEYYQPLRAPADGSLFIADTNSFAIPNNVFFDGDAVVSLVGARDIPLGMMGNVSVGSHTIAVTNNMAGTLIVGGAMTLSGTPTFVVSPNVMMVVTQGIGGGTAELRKDGPGLLRLMGASTYTGETRIMGGALELVGGADLQSTTIQIDAGAEMVATNVSGTFEVGTGQTLKGNGSFIGGLIMDTGSTLAPGLSAGMLTMVGDLTLESASTLEVELNGLTAGTQYDQLLFAGGSWSLTLNNPVLNVVLGFSPVYGNAFQIVSGFSTVSGTFNGLPNGSTFMVGSTLFQIDYTASDITLTVVPEPATLSLFGVLSAAVLLRRRLRR